MNCPYCCRETDDNAVFCTKCGRRIPRCPTCGEVITAKIRFCTKDGTPIPEELTRELPDLEGAAAWESTQKWSAPEETAGYQSPTQSDQQTATQTGSRFQAGEETPKKSNGTLPLIIIAVVVVLAIVLAAVLWANGMLNGSDSQDEEENQTSIVDEETEVPEADSEANAEEDEDPEDALTDETAEPEEAVQIDVSLTTNEISLYEGMTCQIIGENADQVSWSYSVPGIVTVDGSGQLMARAAGTTVATATGPNGETDSVKVTVLAVETEEEQEPEETEDAEDAEDAEVTDVSGDYVLPNSSSEYISESDLYGLTEWECRIARNEIYARYGVIFTKPEVIEYFESKSWYQGTILLADFSTSEFNDYEVKNLEVIVAYEKKMNYNQTKTN
ncbi:MAG: YARHG domain-containing protein [Clostridiales bacterium]|nr:YARHG domain-containing protein [Clostridiales bacterium]